MQKQEVNPIHLCVGVTAHRDLVAAEVPAIEQRVGDFLDQLASEYPELPLKLVTALAEGGDQLAARVALAKGIPILAVLPMEQTEYEQDFGPGVLEEFRRLMAEAEDVIVVPRFERDGVPVSESERDFRELQYANLGIFISNHCQVLLALWDGRKGQHLGGTGQVVEYHLTTVLTEFEADPSPASLLADNENDLVFQVVCSRDRPEGHPADGLEPLQAFWFSSLDDRARHDSMPAPYQILFGRLQRFVLDWKDKVDIVRARSKSLLHECNREPVPGGARLTDRLFRAADGLAVYYQRRVNTSLRTIHILAILMGLVFLVYSEYDGPGYMVLIFLALFFGGVVIHLVGENREWHRKYLDYRTLAEGLRVQFYWNLAGVVDTSSAGFAYDSFLQKQDVDLGWIRHVMRQASMRRVRGTAPDAGWVQWVVDHWIGESDKGDGQLSYYAHKHSVNSHRFRRTRLLGNLCLWAGILTAVFLFLLGGDNDEEKRRFMLILMGVLPLVAGIWDAYSHKRAEKELIKQYGFMHGVFSKARRLLNDASEIEFQRSVLRALGQAALEEGAEWLLMHRERPLEHGRL